MPLSLSDHQTDGGITSWIQAVGVTDAPLPRRNLKAALTFFSRQMPGLSPEMAAHFIRAMDSSRPVREVVLWPGDPLIAFRVGAESPYKLFYGRSGGSKYTSGINHAGRSIVRFEVKTTVVALESYTSGFIDCWTVPDSTQHTVPYGRAMSLGVVVAGGDVQLIIPRSSNYLTAL
jgi:hypothetical protein